MIKLNPSSWKIMLEVLIKAKPLSVKEVPIIFEDRTEGESKFDKKQVLAYLQHLVQLFLYKHSKFVKFCLVGGSGAIITFSLTWVFTEITGFWYMASLVIAVAIATIWNFTLNSIWTFAIKRNADDADYDWTSFYDGTIIQKWWKRSIANIVWEWIPNSSTMLNIGCGSSPIMTHYPDSVNIDMNQDKLNFLQNKMPMIHVQQMEAERLKFDDKVFDYVLCIEMLEHLPNPRSAIKEISRVLKKGGKVVLATPDYNRKHWLLAEKFTPAGEDHVFKFTREKLEKMCQKYDLFPVKHQYVAGCDLVEMFERR